MAFFTFLRREATREYRAPKPRKQLFECMRTEHDVEIDQDLTHLLQLARTSVNQRKSVHSSVQESCVQQVQRSEVH